MSPEDIVRFEPQALAGPETPCEGRFDLDCTLVDSVSTGKAVREAKCCITEKWDHISFEAYEV